MLFEEPIDDEEQALEDAAFDLAFAKVFSEDMNEQPDAADTLERAWESAGDEGQVVS